MMNIEKRIEKYIRFYQGIMGQKILEKEVEFVESKLKGCTDILSVGCGPAYLETQLQKRHPEIHIRGIDIFSAMLHHAPTEITVEQGDAQDLPFPDKSFDAVIFITSLEFITNEKKAIREAHRVLKAGGIFLAALLNTKSQYFKDEYADKKSYIRQNIKHQDLNQIIQYISRYFQIQKREYILGINKGKLCNTNNPLYASLCVVYGKKNS